MNFEEIVLEYISRMKAYTRSAASSMQTTAELSYRPHLDALFRELAMLYNKHAEVIFEPNSQGDYGRPDWRIFDSRTNALYGYVEAKALDLTRPINLSEHRAQVAKYLAMADLVILTDGIEFYFFQPDCIDEPEKYSIIQKPVDLSSNSKIEIDLTLDNRFAEFFVRSGNVTLSENQLIRSVALRAREIAKSVLELTRAPLGSGLSDDENSTIQLLQHLRSTLQIHHDPALQKEEVFADFIAQVLCFGLLYAHRVVADDRLNPKQRYEKIRSFWVKSKSVETPKRMAAFTMILNALDSDSSTPQQPKGVIGIWYDDARRLLSSVRLSETQLSDPNYHTLYERFLTEYDPKSRFDFGAFYTPQELAQFTVALTSAIIRQLFDGRSLFQSGNKIIDPCCGTGTFIEELINEAGPSMDAYLFGLEIQPAPYALAHYRIASLSHRPSSLDQVNIFLANTLRDDLIQFDGSQSPHFLNEELRRARQCAVPPIVLVIGNPPSSDSFSAHSNGENFQRIVNLLQDFRPPQQNRTSRQNTQKQIGNDFIKFLRWAADRVLKSNSGVLALVLPSTFGSHESYRYARQWIAHEFDHLWIVDIDSDLRTGVSSSNIFSTLQGRMLLVAAQKNHPQIENEKTINYASITNLSLQEKKRFLRQRRNDTDYSALFTEHPMDRVNFAFRPTKAKFDRQLYSQFWPIHSADATTTPSDRCLFQRHCSGTKLAPSALFVHPKKPVLERRSKIIGDESISAEEIISQWFRGQKKPPAKAKLVPQIRAGFRSAAANPRSYRQYAFRPFTSMEVLFDQSLLKSMSAVGGGGTRWRPEVVAAFDDPTTIGIAIAPAPLDIGDSIHRFATFCWSLPDNDLCARGNSHVFCNVFPEYGSSRKSKSDLQPKPNISERLLDSIRSFRPTTSINEVVYYVYATLCSSVLLTSFADAYFTTASSQNIPRIPVVNDSQMFDQIVAKGMLLADLERTDATVDYPVWLQPQAQKFHGDFQLSSYVIQEDEGIVRLRSAKGRDEIVIEDIPLNIAQLWVSGYPVLKTWLKFHSYPYTRMSFSSNDFRSFLRLLSVLSRQSEITKEIDVIIERVLNGEASLV